MKKRKTRSRLYMGAVMSCDGFLYPVVDEETWKRRYGLEAFSTQCSGCKKMVRTTRPFAYKAWRGLVAPLCSCGCENPPYCLISTAGDGQNPFRLEKEPEQKKAKTAVKKRRKSTKTKLRREK